jgi:replication-associated recombination protein RarA
MNVTLKYEPKRFADLVFADETARAVCHRYALSNPYRPLMLWGPAGSAKTSTAKVIVAERYLRADYKGPIEQFNGADLTSKDQKKMENIASWLLSQGVEPIMIINELDEMDRSEQAKLRGWMDTWKLIKFIATTNATPTSEQTRGKLLGPLCSRFEKVHIAPPSLQDWLPRAEMIFAAEGYPQSTADLQELLGAFSGDVRGMLPIIEEGLEDLKANAAPVVLPKPLLHVVPGSGKT